MGQNLTNLYISQSFQSLVQISGSQLTDGTGSLISSVNVTAANATNAISASYATTASYALNAGGGAADTGSLLTTASISDATITFTKGDASTFNIVVNNVSNASTASIATSATSASYATTADTATSASFATTASYASNVTTPTLQQVTDQGASTTNTITISGSESKSLQIRNKGVTRAAVSFEDATTLDNTQVNVGAIGDNLYLKGDGGIQLTGSVNSLNGITAPSFTGSLLGNASTATSASYATTASYASKSTSTETINVGNLASNTDAELPVALRSQNPLTGTYYYINTANGITYNPTSSRLTVGAISASSATFTSASIGYLQTVTGSATIIGDAFILLNTSDATRYAGLLVEDSGSATPVNYTASLFFDSLLNDWNYEYTSGSTDYGVALFGPTYSTKGTPTYLTANTIPKGQGNHHLVDSIISDDGSTVTIAGAVSASSFTGSFNGSITLADTASKVTILSTSDNYDYNLIFAAPTSALTESLALRKDDDGKIYWNTATEKLTVDGGSIQTTYFTSSFSAIGGTHAAEVQVDNALTLGNTATTASIKGIASLWLSATNNTGSITGFPNSGRMIIGGENQTISGGTYSMIIGAPASTISSNADQMTIVGGSSNSMSNSGQGILLGGVSNQLQGTRSFLIGGQNNKMGSGAGAGAQYSGIVGGYDNSNDGAYSFTMGSYNNIPSGYSEAIVIGTNITASENSAVHLDNTIVSGSLRGKTNAISIASSTGSMDCSTANFFTLTLANAADTHLTATNVKQGQTINLKLTNNATAAGTISFNTSIFKFEGGVPFTATATTNAVDVMTFISFDGSTFQATGLKNFS